MGTTGSTNTNSRLVLLCSILSVVFPAVGFAAETNGGITVGVSRSDNIFLESSPNEVDDTVFRVSPFLTVLHNSPSLDAALRYRLDWYNYSDIDASSTFHMGEATLVGKALDESLAVEIGGRRNQALTDPSDVIPGGRLPISGNLTDRDELWINPRYRHTFARAVTLDASYRHTEGSYDDSRFQDDTSKFGTFSLENYEAGQGFTVALRYNWRRSEYDVSLPWEHQDAQLELGYWASATTRVFASGGRESPWDDPFRSGLDDTMWEAGFAYSPGDNLSAELAAGEREFGTTLRAKLNWTFRRGSTSFTYVETPTNSGFNRTGQQGSIQTPDALDDFLLAPGSAETFLLERLA